MYVGGNKLIHCNKLRTVCPYSCSAENDLREKLNMSQQYVLAAMQTNHIPSCVSNFIASRQKKWLFLSTWHNEDTSGIPRLVSGAINNVKKCIQNGKFQSRKRLSSACKRGAITVLFRCPKLACRARPVPEMHHERTGGQ